MNAGGNETRGKAATNVNPFQPPDTQIESEADSLGVDWRLFTYTLVGFAIGTALVAPLVLAVNPFDRLVVGAAIGGPIGAILGFAYGERRRKAENFNGRKRMTAAASREPQRSAMCPIHAVGAWLPFAAEPPSGSTAVTCSSEQMRNSAGTPSSAISTPTSMSDLVSIAISGCRTSYDWPLDITSRNGRKGRWANSSWNP